MRHLVFSKLLWVLAWLSLAGCQKAPSEQTDSPANAAPPKRFEKVREPAVAGLFYPRDEDTLKRQVDRLLAGAKSEPSRTFEHWCVLTRAMSIPPPLPPAGTNNCSVATLRPSSSSDRAITRPFRAPLCRRWTPTRRRWAWCRFRPWRRRWPRSSRLRPIRPARSSGRTGGRGHPNGAARRRRHPRNLEHSLEVQLPFLQRTLSDFRIVPVIFGQAGWHQVAEKLLPFLDNQTLIVVSTDLSHYHPYDEAKALDTRTVAAICDLRGDRLTGDDACGYAGVVTLIDIARRKGWKARLLDYRNSGDTAGDKSAVVGYAAIAMFGSDGVRRRTAPSSDAAHSRRRAAAVAGVGAQERDRRSPRRRCPARGRRRAGEVPRPSSVFRHPYRKRPLRGCIGSIFPQESLYQAVIERAKSAATEDPRFPPVRPEELKGD